MVLGPGETVQIVELDLLLFAPLRPWAIGDLVVLDEFPFNAVAAADGKEISHGWANVDTGIAIGVRFWLVAFENVLPVVCIEWATVFPLGVADFFIVVDGDPATFADRRP